MRSSQALAAATVLALALGTNPLAAQTYPTKPVLIVVPSSAGGPADVAARLISERLSQALGQQVVIETAPGAGGTIGMGRVARAAPDGYTLLIHQNGFAIAPALYSRLTFDTAKDFVTVGLVNRSDIFIVGRKSLPANSFPELVAWMKGPGKPARVGHPGIGTLGHLQTTMLVNALGSGSILVAYKGIAPAVTDLLGERIDVTQVGPPVAGPHVRANRIKLYATTGFSRNKNFPDVPTVGEFGHKDLQSWFWHALFAPAGTPRPVVEKLNAALRETLADERVRTNYAAALVEAFPEAELTVEASQKFVRDELALWAKVVRDNNIKAD